MRMRNKKNVGKRLDCCAAFFIDNTSLDCASPCDFFDVNRRVHLEIGCGKGGFAAGMAIKNPDVNFIAVESNKNVMVLAVEKAQRLGLDNLKFVLSDAAEIEKIFAPHCFETIYLNFSDPWKKARHEKRRLTYKSFLATYSRLLSSGGRVIMKTDNVPLFEYSLMSFSQNGYELSEVTDNLHSLDCSDNVMTEYEELFSLQGHKICRLIATPQNN